MEMEDLQRQVLFHYEATNQERKGSRNASRVKIESSPIWQIVDDCVAIELRCGSVRVNRE